MSFDIQWWGYLHTNGTIQVKRFFDTLDIIEAADSPFVQRTTGPFNAVDRADAVKIVTERLQ